MALKKGKATDAVAKLFSVPAVEPNEELHMPETREAHEAYEVQAKPRMPHMPYTLKRMISCRKNTFIR